jgi:biotin operon repressor
MGKYYILLPCILLFAMNVNNAVFSLVSVKPSSIADIRKRLPFGAKAIYANIERLVKEGLLVKVRGAEGILVIVADGYQAQKLKEIHIKCLSHGIDPEMLLRDSTLDVWRLLDVPRTVSELEDGTGLSSKWIMHVLNVLERHGLVIFQKRKPVLAVRDHGNVINGLLSDYLLPQAEEKGIFYPGTRPFTERMSTPDQIERALYGLQGGLAVRDTGFVTRGGSNGGIMVLESVEKTMGMEEIFLRKLMTTDGAEDFCIHMVAQRLLDYDILFEVAKKKNMINIAGCYLDVLRSIDLAVPDHVIDLFKGNVSKRRRSFLIQEKRYGKSGWEVPFENDWNVDLYLDRDALRHGARSA